MTLPAHFWSKVDKTEGCWIWTGGRAGGYGTFANRKGERRSTRAHRVAWEDVNGPVPDGLELDHLCNTPACVRPSHLEAVTHAVNMQRQFDRRVTCFHGHPMTPESRVCLPCRRKRVREAVRRHSARRIPADQIVPWDVRVWAWENGVPCNRIGRVPRAVVAAYLAAHDKAGAA